MWNILGSHWSDRFVLGYDERFSVPDQLPCTGNESRLNDLQLMSAHGNGDGKPWEANVCAPGLLKKTGADWAKM